MFKLYVLGIIFYVCAVVLSEPHAKELVKQVNDIKKKSIKGKIKAWINVIVMGLMPVINVVIGIMLLVMMSGKIDDVIIEALNEENLK